MSRTWKDAPYHVKVKRYAPEASTESPTVRVYTPPTPPESFFYAHQQKEIREFREHFPHWTETEVQGFPAISPETNKVVKVLSNEEAQEPKGEEEPPHERLLDLIRRGFRTLETPPVIKYQWNVFVRFTPPTPEPIEVTYTPVYYNFRAIPQLRICPEGRYCDYCQDNRTHKHRRRADPIDTQEAARQFNSGGLEEL